MWEILTIVGTVASLIGLYAFVDNRKNRRIKALVYERSDAVALARTRKLKDYSLTIHYQRGGGTEEVIDAAFVSFLRFANFGREPIRSADIAPASPLRVVVDNARVLDIALESASRDVIRLKLPVVTLTASTAIAALNFDFLDYHDGGVIRVISTSSKMKPRLDGEIIGMPAGIARSGEDSKSGMQKWAVGLWVLCAIGLFGLAGYVTQDVAGGWGKIYLLFLPIATLVLALSVGFVLDELMPSRRKRSYPQTLALPRWTARTPYRDQWDDAPVQRETVDEPPSDEAK